LEFSPSISEGLKAISIRNIDIFSAVVNKNLAYGTPPTSNVEIYTRCPKCPDTDRFRLVRMTSEVVCPAVSYRRISEKRIA
jgi:hypothetical protein